MIKGPDTPHWHGRRSSVEAHCCVASCLLRPAKKLHLITPETTAKDYDQQASTFCACMKGNASLWICKLLIWLSSIYDAALANIAVSMSDKKRQRRKKKEKLFCTDTFYLNRQSVIFLTDAQSGPKTDKGPFPRCLLANYPIEWLLVLSVFIDLMMATPVNSGASLHLRVPFLAMNTINKLLS